MAESVDATVSNTVGAIHPGSIPGSGTETGSREIYPLFFIYFIFLFYLNTYIMSIKKCFSIEWHGPFTEEDLKDELMKNKLADFRFYLLSGCRKYQHGDATWQYCGITERIVTNRFKDKNHKISTITRNKFIWLGKFGNKSFSKNRANIELIEHLIISAFLIDQNEKKTKSFPKEPIGIINLWFTKNGERRIRKVHKIQKDMSDVIVYDGYDIWYADKLNR